MVNMFVSVVNFDILVIHLLESKSEVVQLQRSKTHLKWYVKIIKIMCFHVKKAIVQFWAQLGLRTRVCRR